MSYCTLQDILDSMDEEEVVGYTDDYDTGTVNIDATDKAIAKADALINFHIAAKYSIPLSPVPDIINSLAVDIAIYKISSRRAAAPEGIRKTYEDAVKSLEKVAQGKAILPDAASAPATSSTGAVKITSDTRLFTRDDMGGF